MKDDFEAISGFRPTEFVCPLCLREVHRDCVSAAHSPARRVGGKAVTLNCRSCNSQMGTWYEAATIGMLRNRAASKSGVWTESLRAGSGEDGQNLVAVKVTYDTTAPDGPPTISVWPAKPGSPSSEYWAKQVVRIVSTPGSTVRFEGRLPGPQAVGRTFLYWAFLNLTAQVGYAFATSPGARIVAEALLDRTSTVLGKAYRLQTPDVGAVLREIEPSEPFIMFGPGEYADVLCVGWRFGDFQVFLPWPTDAVGEVYRKLDAKADAGKRDSGLARC